MADPTPDRYSDFLPSVYRQPDGKGSAAFLDLYLTIFQQIVGRRLEPSSQDPPDTVVRKGMASVIDVLPSLFYPRLAFLFPDDDAFIPPFNPTTQNNPNYTSEKMDELNDYFGIADPAAGQDWQTQVTQAVTLWLSDFLDWQSAWIGLRCDNNWTLDNKREVMARSLPMFRRRGTAGGLEELLQVYVGGDIQVQDMVDAPAMTVGYTTTLKTAYESGDAVVGGVRPFAFLVQLSVATYDLTSPAIEQTVAAIKALVDTEKPLHTNYLIQVIPVPVKLGVRSTVGVDFLLPMDSNQMGGI